MSDFEHRMTNADPAASLADTAPAMQDARAQAIIAAGDEAQPSASARWRRWVLLAGALLVVALVVMLTVNRPTAVPVLGTPTPSATPTASSETTASGTPTTAPPATAAEILQLAAANASPDPAPGQYLVVREWGSLAGGAAGQGSPAVDGVIVTLDLTSYEAAVGTPYRCTIWTQPEVAIGSYGSATTSGFATAPRPPSTSCTQAPSEGSLAPKQPPQLPTEPEALAAALADVAASWTGPAGEAGALDRYFNPVVQQGTRAAVLGYLASRPDVEIMATDVTVGGRSGTAVWLVGQPAPLNLAWVFDPETGDYLGKLQQVNGASHVLAISGQVVDRLPDRVVSDACTTASSDISGQAVCPIP